ncbi:MAG: 4-hydroxy-3-methylbut-2-enyl diphosphate reductase [bacterium]
MTDQNKAASSDAWDSLVVEMKNNDRYFQRGLGNRAEIVPQLRADYHNKLVDSLKQNDYRIASGTCEVRLAREFGFCYGVDRAVEYAYETRERFPEKRIFLTGEIIHNPRVNGRLREMGVLFLPQSENLEERFADVHEDDVVIIPAFGVETAALAALAPKKCILVDTTCGSVLNVWKSVIGYAQDGFTAIVHGKYAHEETRATCSQVSRFPNGGYLVVRDREEAAIVCEYIERGGDRAAFLERFAPVSSPEFDPDTRLERIGVANQTTMLSSESLEIAEMLRQAIVTRHGADEAARRFRSFDTICSATQDRQDAVVALINEGVDLMIVIGGFNSSNTTHLLEIAGQSVPSYHIENASCLLSADEIRHKPLARFTPVVARDWLPRGAARIGITAGASTPNSEIGAAIERIFLFRGEGLPAAEPA